MKTGRRLVLGAVLLALAPAGLARAVLVQVGFEGFVGTATGTLGGAQSFSGTIVYSTDGPSCTSIQFGQECAFDDGSATLTAQLGGAGPVYATDPTDPLVEILLQQYIVDRNDPDQPVPPEDPEAALREVFAPRSVVNEDLGVGDYTLGLLIDRVAQDPPFLYIPNGFGLLEPSATLAAELLGAGFDLQVDPGGPGAGSAFGTVTSTFVIPEPVTASLLLVGLAGLALAGRRSIARR